MNALKSSRRALYHLYATLFLKESFLTGSSAARLMLLSRMKKRMRLVKMLWLTTLWQRTLNLQNKVQERKKAKCFHLVSLKEKDAKRIQQKLTEILGGENEVGEEDYLLVWLKIKKARASGMGTAFSFSWMSERGRGLGPTGISGSSSSSSPD